MHRSSREALSRPVSQTSQSFVVKIDVSTSLSRSAGEVGGIEGFPSPAWADHHARQVPRLGVMDGGARDILLGEKRSPFPLLGDEYVLKYRP